MSPESATDQALENNAPEKLSGVPAAAVEILGSVVAVTIESYSDAITDAAYACSAPDPFQQRRNKRLELEQSTQDPYKVIESAYSIRSGRLIASVYKGLNRSTRRQLEILESAACRVEEAGVSVIEGMDRMKNLAVVDCRWGPLVDAVIILAQDIPPSDQLKRCQESLGAEIGAFIMSKIAPDKTINQMIEQVRFRSSDQLALSEKILDAEAARNPQSVQAIEELRSRKNSLRELFAFHERAESAGKEIWHELVSQAYGSLLAAQGMLGLLLVGAKDKSELWLREQLESGEEAEAALWKAMAVEEYLARRAIQLSKADKVEAIEVKLPIDHAYRELVNLLKTRPLFHTLQRAGRRARPQPAPHETIPADPEFRHKCKEAKDILKGGARLDHPQASHWARHLHGLQFRNQLRLDQAESGIIVATLAGKLPVLVETKSRLGEAATGTDPQVEKFRHELRDQFVMLNGFNLRLAVDKLIQILTNPDHRNRLLNVLSGGEINQLQAEITELHEQLMTAEDQSAS